MPDSFPLNHQAQRTDPHVLRTWCVLGLVSSVYLPLSFVHLQQLWKLPHYQFVPLLIVGVAFLAWRMRPEPFGSDSRSRRFGYVWIALALALQVMASAIYSPWLAMAALLISSAGMACILFDRADRRTLLPLWLLLWLVVPLPFGGDRLLIQELQSMTSWLASAALDLLGVYHLLAGNVMELPDRKLFVDEACSGVNTVFALLALSGLFAFRARRPWPVAVPLMVSAGFWASLMNVVRIVCIVCAWDYWSLDLTEGHPHTLLSLFLLPITLVLLLGTDHLLMFLFGPVHRHGEQDVILPSLARLWNRMLGWNEIPLDAVDGVRSASRTDAAITGMTTVSLQSTRHVPQWIPAAGVLSLILCVLQIGFLGRAVATVPASLAFGNLNEVSLPAEFRGWTRSSFRREARQSGDDFGERSLIWSFTTDDECFAAVSFDYPFINWHELTTCYEKTGWTVTTRKTLRPDDENSAIVVAELNKPTGERGVLVFSLFDREGNIVSPPDGLLNQLGTRLRSSLTRYRLTSETYQFQLFLEVPPHVGRDHAQDVIARFLQLRQLVRGAVGERA